MNMDGDQGYRERNVLVCLLARIYPSGIRATEIEGWEPEWNNCVYIDLPTGQVSYHYHDTEKSLFAWLPAYTKPYDGHDKATAEARILELASQIAGYGINRHG